MKFKSDIEVQAGLKDSSGSIGTSGQVLSSTGSNVSWINQSAIASDVQNQVKAGVAINKGQAVYVTGADGTNIIVGLASNASEATSSKTLGLLDATVAINGFANVVQIGKLSGLNTLGATAGDPVWLGTGGNLIYGLVGKPYAPANLVFIGIVTRVNVNNGEIFVNVQNGFELNEIHDVDLKTTVPISGDILGFNGTLWVNKTIAGWLGYTPANANGTVNYVSKFTGTTTLGNSLLFDNGTNVGIGTSSPSAKLDVSSGNINLSNSFNLTGRNNANTFNIALIGRNTSDRVIIDADGYGTNIGGGGTVLLNPTGGNVGIGTSIPSAKTQIFTDRYNDSLTFNATAGLIIGGSIRQLSINTDDTSPYNISLQAKTNGNGAANIILNSLGGNVGIGTSSISAKLHVSGNTLVTGTLEVDTVNNGVGDFLTRTAGGIVTRRTAAEVLSDIGGQSALTNPVTGTGTLNFVSKFTSNGSTLGNSQIFDNGTNVGIGTTSPSEKFEVQNSAAGAKIKVSNSGGGYATLECSSNATSVAQLTFTNQLSLIGGNVGIGTTSPSEKLVVGNLGGGVKRIYVPGTYNFDGSYLSNYDGNGGGKLELVAHTGVSNSASWRIANNNDTYGQSLTFSYAPNTTSYSALSYSAPAMLIANTGNVGIGTTSPGEKLSVKSADAAIKLEGSTNSYLFQIVDSNNRLRIFDNTNNVERITLTSGGDVGIGTSGPLNKVDIVSSNNDSFGAITVRPSNQTQTLSLGWQGVSASLNFIVNAGASERMRITSVGNTGINTSIPETRLQIEDITKVLTNNVAGVAQGTLSLVSTDAQTANIGASLVFGGNYITSNSSRIAYAAITGRKSNSTSSNADGYLSFLTWRTSGLTEAMRITANGDVGVGTTTPLLTSAVRGNITINGSSQSVLTLATGGVWKSYLYSDGTNTDLSSAASLIFGINGGGEAARINTSGHLGVGTTNPTSRIHSVTNSSGPVSYDNRCAVFGYNTATETTFNNGVGIAGRVLTSGGRAVYGDALTGSGWGGYFDGRGYFLNQLLIGTTDINTPTYGSAAQFVTSSSTGGVIDIRNINTTIGTGALLGRIQFTGKSDASVGYTAAAIDVITSNIAGTGSSGGGILRFMTAAAGGGQTPTARMWINQAGYVSIGLTNTASYPLRVTTQVSNISIYADYDIVAFSDKSVKENIRPIENVVERIQKSRGVLYDRIDSESKDNIGFIAQELEVAFPELIVTNEDGTKAVKYQNAVAVLFEAVKEQQKQIDEIKQILNGLTN